MLFTSNGCRKCIFLHENLKEVVYMEPSPRYPLSISNLACKLIKSLYSLKKAPRAWFENDYSLFSLFSFLDSSKASMITHYFHLVMESLSFFIYWWHIITWSDYNGIVEVKSLFKSSFHVKDLGLLTYFLDLDITHPNNELSIYQWKHIKDLIKLANLIDNKTCATPFELNLKIKHEDEQLIFNPNLYICLVKSLVYFTITRPYIYIYILQCRLWVNLFLTLIDCILLYFIELSDILKEHIVGVYSFLLSLLLYLMLLYIRIMLVVWTLYTLLLADFFLFLIYFMEVYEVR